MLDGVMLLWFILTALSLAFVAIDIRSTPESTVMKWGFILLTAFTGPISAFLYVLGCREPLAGMHEAYVSVRWRQVLGSTMHCVAGDGVGIIAGALIAVWIALPGPAEMLLEYLLGFAFGWGVFQALFMKNMAGGSYAKSLKSTFMAELLSMNVLMAGMMPAMMIPWVHVQGAHDPAQPTFWFRMSMALLFGFICAYPMNWWLVSRGLKHGMMTVRPAGDPGAGHANHASAHPAPMQMSEHAKHGGKHQAHGAGAVPMDHSAHAASAPPSAHVHPASRTSGIGAMTILSFALLAVGVFAAMRLGGG
jgi:hypothetical protein